MFDLTVALITQIALGAMDLIPLVLVSLQMMHLLVAKIVWTLLLLAPPGLLFVEHLCRVCGRTDRAPQVMLRHDPDLPSNLCQERGGMGVFFRCGEGSACLLLVENREDNLIYGAGSFWADRCYTEQRDKRRKLSSHGGAGDIS